MKDYNYYLNLCVDAIEYQAYVYKYLGHDVQEDIRQEGRMAVYHAMQLYNENLGSFKSYATQWIKTYVYDYLNKVVAVVSHSREVHRKILAIKKCFEEHPNATMDEVCQYTGMSRYQVNEYFHGFSKVSMDAQIDDDGKLCIGDVIADESYVDKREQQQTDEMMNRIKALLTDSEREILFSSYGIGCKKKKQSEIAEDLGITHQAVSKRINTIISKLQDNLSDANMFN